MPSSLVYKPLLTQYSAIMSTHTQGESQVESEKSHGPFLSPQLNKRYTSEMKNILQMFRDIGLAWA